MVTFLHWFISIFKSKSKSKKIHNDDDDNNRDLELSQVRTNMTMETPRQSQVYSRPSQAYSRQQHVDSDFFNNPNESIIDKSIHQPSSSNVKFKKNYWKNLNVGDILRIHKDEEVPADILIISVSDPEGTCFIETKNLDGETNLKSRHSMHCGNGIKHSFDCERMKFWCDVEQPQPNLYSFNGVLKWNHSSSSSSDEEKINSEPIDINNILLRGSTIRNTKWIIGIVLFTGPETKIMLNAGITPTKRSRITRELNVSIITNFIVLFIICFVSGIINGVYYHHNSSSEAFFGYGSYAHTPPKNGIVAFFVGIILYQTLVPISLYISIEIIKTFQAGLIYSDVLMYFEKLDYPCTPKSWNISDDLGQIEYIFSDKTGTLTQNIMEFKKLTCSGESFGLVYTEAMIGLHKRQGINVQEEEIEIKKLIHDDKLKMIDKLQNISNLKERELNENNLTFISSDFINVLTGEKGGELQKNAKDFLFSLAVCHTVVTERNEGSIEFKAESPDESALVSTASDLGFTFLNRSRNIIELDIQGLKQRFKILDIIEFNSSRKRMSVIIEIPNENGEHEIKLICKGADNIIYQRLNPNSDSNLLKETAIHLENFARDGLRTLCIASKTLSRKEYNDWKIRYDNALSSIENRNLKIEMEADSIEQDLNLIGGTAIEDRLQDGVPDSIEILGQAGIKLWVLTGDKVETAINIGFSCNLLENNMELLVITSKSNSSNNNSDNENENGGRTLKEMNDLLDDYLKKYFNLEFNESTLKFAKNDHSKPSLNHAIVIDGDSLNEIINFKLDEKFVLLCKQCRSVLCCRVSPSQKAKVVLMVKKTLDVMTLSIGDGANDIAMIQAADVGVGIAGEEGRQAVMSSDFGLAQFRFLTRLILVHGRWSYKRLSEMIPCFFYKNIVFTLSLFWYSIYNDFDGSYLFEFTYLMLYNLFFTSLPVIFMGVLDQDVTDTVSLLNPQLYITGILRKEWNLYKFWFYMIDGIYQSVISFYFPYLLFYKGNFTSKNGLPLDHRYWIGVMVCSISVISCNVYVLSHQKCWDWLSIIIFWFSNLLLFFWTGIWSAGTFAEEFYKSAPQVYGSVVFWAILFVGIIANLLPRIVYDTFKSIYFPKDIDIIREQAKLGAFDNYVKHGYDPTAPKTININNETQNHNNDNSITTSSNNLSPASSTYDEEANISNQLPSTSTTNNENPNGRRRNSSIISKLIPNKRVFSLKPPKRPQQISNSGLFNISTRTSLDGVRSSVDLPGLSQAHTLLSLHTTRTRDSHSHLRS